MHFSFAGKNICVLLYYLLPVTAIYQNKINYYIIDAKYFSRSQTFADISNVKRENVIEIIKLSLKIIMKNEYNQNRQYNKLTFSNNFQ